MFLLYSVLLEDKLLSGGVGAFQYTCLLPVSVDFLFYKSQLSADMKELM